MSNVYDDEKFFKEYSKMYRSQKGLEGAGEWHQLKPLFPDLTDKKVLDLGCGYGWHCKYAVECGADGVVGIDLSEKMIATARERNADERINYKVCGMDAYDYPQDTFDLVVSNLVLHYIEDLNGIYKNVYRTLKDNGIFLFNIEHPVFTGSVNQDWIYDNEGNALYWPVDNYFYPGLRQTHFLGQEVTKQHHTLTQIINGLLQCGFFIERVEEAMPEQGMMGFPGMKDEMRRPMMLLVKASKITDTR
ncbi:MAG TPA: class I SAM-dependent methyltransferase [Clostridiales bacterium]|nr:class I SAM-dependent methyltransferase [Clostridiales bacterium]